MSDHERRVLVLPATSTDGIAINKLLAANGVGCVTFAGMSALCAALRSGAGVVLVAEEPLLADPDALYESIAAQAVWSNVPVIILSRSGHETTKLAPALAHLGDATVVERPIRTTTLVTLVRSSLRVRDRQYQMREAMSEREALLDSERAARSEAERAGRIKDEFLATLSHELRTPLNAILGWTHVLKKGGALDSASANAVDVIERNARSQAQIIADLLDMSSIISGKVRLEVRRLDLASVIEATIETIRPTAQAKNIRLDIAVDREAGPVRGDPNRLQQVFWNLLTNAVKFTPKDGLVTVTLAGTRTHVSVEVTDNGEGMEPRFLPHVFDRFRQADASTTRRHGGLGLGLSIVKQIVELHGGSIDARSGGPGQGSTFHVTLPVMTDTEDLEATRRMPVLELSGSATTDSTRAISLANVKVLVVDDEPDARALVERLLSDAHADVRVAGSVGEALQILEFDPPDVLVSDIGMPGEDGYTLIRQVRSLTKEVANIPAIALTAYARAEDRVKAIEAGFQRHLSKPVEPGELIALVAHLTSA